MCGIEKTLIKGVNNEVLFAAIREKLNPFLDPSLQDTEEGNELLNKLESSCYEVLTPFREFLEDELPQYDYTYNDVVGFEEGKWSGEVRIMLSEGLHFTGNDIELLQEFGRPLYLLTVELSLVYPLYFMAIEQWELSRTRKNWIDCTAANQRVKDFSFPVFKCRKYLEDAGFHAMPQESLEVILPRQITEAKLVIGSEPEEFTLVQLLFNELFDSDIDILTLSGNPLN